MEDFITYDDVEVYSSEIVEELPEVEQTEVSETSAAATVSNPDALTNDVFNQGVQDIVNSVNPDAVQNDVYRDYGVGFALGDVDLPEYVTKYQVNGVDIYFPTDYAEDVFVVDGMLVNLGANYTVGAQIDGYDVSNYLSSEITIPTYHSSTWYQYMQNYGQPYRVVDRYVSNYGSISSSTRDSVSLEFSGSPGWAGFTFEKVSLLLILSMLFIMFVFRKGSK